MTTRPFHTTRTGLQIGRQYVRPPRPISSLDEVHIQSALLEPKTARPLHPIRKLLAPVWRWL